VRRLTCAPAVHRRPPFCAVSSVVEHYLDTVGVGGSKPPPRTIFPNENEVFIDSRTDSAQILAGSEKPKVKFPKIIRHRRIEATIYGKKPGYQFYRIAYYVAGKRQQRSFRTYQEAKAEAELKVREIADGSQAAALNADNARDAIAALQRLETLRLSTGRRFSLLAAVSDFAGAVEKLRGRAIGEAVEGFLRMVVSIQPKEIKAAVEEFIDGREHKSQSKDGKRAQLSAEYARHVAKWLREFAETYPGTMVSDLSKEHLDGYMKKHTTVAAKNRNDRRQTVKMFLNWAVRKDYLPVNHRLFEADGMAREIVEAAETDFFRPNELKGLLDNAATDLLPVIALGGLGGLRVEEIMRLEWADVWRVAGHVEITARNSKTRQRRLVEMCPALAEWLTPYRKATGAVWDKRRNLYQIEFSALRETLKIPARRNGLRHAFCTYHFALHANENLTAQQAGNSPTMIHAHYKGLATKAEAEKWFAAKP
jgi:integrase